MSFFRGIFEIGVVLTWVGVSKVKRLFGGK